MIMLSTPAMKRDLRVLWAKSFPDSQTVIHFFFQHRYRPDQCLVMVQDGRVVSALHLLPAQIVTEDGRCPVQYIYAAATLPEYRNTGCMTKLLHAAEELGVSRGIPYTALVPSGQSLFAYYERAGFVPYFETRTVRITRQELKHLARGGREKRAEVSARLLSSVRIDALRNEIGNVLWDRDAFAFAAEYQQIAQGEVFSAATAGSVGYAFFQQEEQTGIVTEAIANEAVLSGLANQLQSKCRSPLILFCLPVDSPLFPGKGEITCTGMLKVNGEIGQLPNGKHPYLGLDLN